MQITRNKLVALGLSAILGFSLTGCKATESQQEIQISDTAISHIETTPVFSDIEEEVITTTMSVVETTEPEIVFDTAMQERIDAVYALCLKEQETDPYLRINAKGTMTIGGKDYVAIVVMNRDMDYFWVRNIRLYNPDIEDVEQSYMFSCSFQTDNTNLVSWEYWLKNIKCYTYNDDILVYSQFKSWTADSAEFSLCSVNNKTICYGYKAGVADTKPSYVYYVSGTPIDIEGCDETHLDLSSLEEVECTFNLNSVDQE